MGNYLVRHEKDESLTVKDRRGRPIGRILEYEIGRVSELAWSPTGRWFSFLATDARSYESVDRLYVYDAGRRTLRCLISGNGSSPTWSRDGRLLAFIQSTISGYSSGSVQLSGGRHDGQLVVLDARAGFRRIECVGKLVDTFALSPSSGEAAFVELIKDEYGDPSPPRAARAEFALGRDKARGDHPPQARLHLGRRRLPGCGRARQIRRALYRDGRRQPADGRFGWLKTKTLPSSSCWPICRSSTRSYSNPKPACRSGGPRSCGRPRPEGSQCGCSHARVDRVSGLVGEGNGTFSSQKHESTESCFGKPFSRNSARSEYRERGFPIQQSRRSVEIPRYPLLRNCWFRDKGVPKQRRWFLSNVTAATPRSLARNDICGDVYSRFVSRFGGSGGDSEIATQRRSDP